MSSVSPAKWDKMNLSFAGCGFLGLYHVGVASCFREYAPYCCTNKVSGASAGALAAMALVCRLPLGESTSEILHVAIKARARALGPFHPSFDVNKIIYDGLVKTLPEDAHKRATGRLFISVTRVSDGKNVLINQYDSKEDLIRAIQCSCFIPFWSGIVPPKFHGVAYMDGGFSDNLPVLDKHSVTVSPFCGESDICPQDDVCSALQMNIVNTSITLSPMNLYRITRILFPAHPEVLSKMCQQGFDDALRFLQRNNQIACTRCLAIQTSFTVGDDDDLEADQEGSDSGYEHWDDDQLLDNCLDCQYRRQVAVLDSLPDTVVQAIQRACDQVNKGLINWLFRLKPVIIMSIVSIPAMLPLDLTYLFAKKILNRLPPFAKMLKNSFFRFVNFIGVLVKKMESKRHLYSAKFSCQLALTEFNYSNENAPTACSAPSSRKVSAVSSPRRKVTRSSNKVEKAHSFAGRRNQPFEENQPRMRRLTGVRPGLQRRSYAGSEFSLHTHSGNYADRRRSMVEIMPGVKPPERVLSKLNFGFSFDVKNKSKSSEFDFVTDVPDNDSTGGEQVIDALKQLDDIDDANAIEIANKALDLERECLGKYHEFNDRESEMGKMIEVTKRQDALMAYYYKDENNRVNVTELFNVCETMSDDEPRSNDADDEDGLSERPLEAQLQRQNSRSAPSLSSVEPITPKRQRKKSFLFKN